MWEVNKQTYQERFDMYNECDKDVLIGYLYERDKYPEYIKNTPKYLVYSNYNNFTKTQLAELLAEREIYEYPMGCVES